MHHNRFITGVLLAGVIAVLSCGKESPTVGGIGTSGGTAIEYSVETGTRATLVDSREGFVGMSDNSFVVTAMNGTATTVPTQTVTYSSTKDRWCTVTPYVWPYSAGVMSELTFYAWTTPATGQGTVSLNTSTGKATFSYTTPASAKDQKDIMFGYFKGSNAQGIASLSFKHALAAVDMKMGTVLPGYSVNDATKTASFSYSVLSGTAVTDLRDVMVALYTGKGDNGRADLEFFHPLAAVSFVSGAVSDVTLKSITVRNVYPAGNCSVTWGSDPVPSVVWDFTGKSANASFTYTPSSPVPLDGSGITIAGGENTFILPPQTLGASAELSMNVSITGVDKTAKCSLEGTTWKAGYNCKYTINVDSGLIYADVSFEPWSHDGVTLNPKN